MNLLLKLWYKLFRRNANTPTESSNSRIQYASYPMPYVNKVAITLERTQRIIQSSDDLVTIPNYVSLDYNKVAHMVVTTSDRLKGRYTYPCMADIHVYRVSGFDTTIFIRVTIE